MLENYNHVLFEIKKKVIFMVEKVSEHLKWVSYGAGEGWCCRTVCVHTSERLTRGVWGNHLGWRGDRRHEAPGWINAELWLHGHT